MTALWRGLVAVFIGLGSIVAWAQPAAAHAVLRGTSEALVALVPGRSLALVEKGPVTRKRSAGPYRVQRLMDPSSIGENSVHVTYITEAGLAAGEVTNTAVHLASGHLASGSAPARPVEMRLIAPATSPATSPLHRRAAVGSRPDRR